MIVRSVFIATVIPFLGCNGASSNLPRENGRNKETMQMELRINTPEKAFEWFDDRDVARTKDALRVDSLKNVQVTFVDAMGRHVALLDFDLIIRTIYPDFSAEGLAQPDISYSISMNAIPNNLSVAVDDAKDLCQFFGIEDKSIIDWYESRSFEDPLRKSVLQAGHTEKCDISVEIRPSFNPQSPWFIVLTIAIK